MQDESRSISENSTWGIRRRFEQGKLHINHVKFLGYDKDINGNLIINTKQAKIVRRIYREFLDGKGANRIAKELEHDGVPNWNGKSKWYDSSIKKMLLYFYGVTSNILGIIPCTKERMSFLYCRHAFRGETAFFYLYSEYFSVAELPS